MFESRPDTASKLKMVPSAAISGALLKQNFRWNKKIKLYSLVNLKTKFSMLFLNYENNQHELSFVALTLLRSLHTH